MKEQEGGGRPQWPLTSNTRQGESAPQPTAHSTEEESGWQGRSHPELVQALRDFIRPERKHWWQNGRDHWLPEEVIWMELHLQRSGESWESEEAHARRRAFFIPLRNAWAALTYERYEPENKPVANSAGYQLERHCQTTGQSIVRLTHPLQVKVIDALTEVCGVPHAKGQTAIAIPEKPRHYTQLMPDFRFFTDRLLRSSRSATSAAATDIAADC
jgi:hypothetical protein